MVLLFQFFVVIAVVIIVHVNSNTTTPINTGITMNDTKNNAPALALAEFDWEFDWGFDWTPLFDWKDCMTPSGSIVSVSIKGGNSHCRDCRVSIGRADSNDLVTSPSFVSSDLCLLRCAIVAVVMAVCNLCR